MTVQGPENGQSSWSSILWCSLNESSAGHHGRVRAGWELDEWGGELVIKAASKGEWWGEL